MGFFYLSDDAFCRPEMVELSDSASWAFVSLCCIVSKYDHRRFTPRQLAVYETTPSDRDELIKAELGTMDGDLFVFDPPVHLVRFTEPSERRSRTTSEGSTYIVQAGEDGPVKIGRTRGDVTARVRSLQTGSADPLRVVHVIDGAHHEAELHDRFADWRLGGEWFDNAVLEMLDR